MRQVLLQSLREYYAEVDDATQEQRVRLEGGVPVQDPDRFNRLLLRAIREQEADIRELKARVAALEEG